MKIRHTVGFFVLFCFMGVSASVLASVSSSDIDKTGVEMSAEKSSLQKDLEVEKYEQSFWGLSNEDWALYQKIKPIAQQLSKTEVPSTPPEVLGIFARTTKDRERYAKMFATKFVQYVDSSIVSMRLVRTELRKLNQGRTMFDYKRLNAMRGDVIGVGDRIQFFTEINCDDCHARLAQLINQVRFYKVKLDVFVVDDSSNADLQEYAASYLPVDLVEKGLISINRDKSFMVKHKLTVPASFISKDGGALEMHTLD
jgi:integrating conjugative element protein (TIGR03759 family)